MKKVRKITIIAGLCLFLVGCVTANIRPPPQEVVVKIKNATGQKAEKAEISKSMEITNTDLEFSTYTKIHGDKAYITLTSVGSWSAESMWKDFKLIRIKEIKQVVLYLNNPGGSAFDGFGITDQIRLLKNDGITIIAEASGIVASAAIPVFLICNKRIATKNTIFLIHPASIAKLFSVETLKDIESQAIMFRLSRKKYAEIVVQNSNLLLNKILDLMDKDNWFDVHQAKKWGMVDEIQ